jgi:uncharacterized protein
MNKMISRHFSRFESLAIFLVFTFLHVGTSLAVRPSAIPEKPVSWVSDYAQVLNPAEQEQLNQRLALLEKETSTQIFVAIFPALPEDFYLEDFSVKLFEQWRPGSNHNNNGVLLTIFMADRKLRIEVGYGLEDVLTDALSDRIIQAEILPHFKNGAYASGISQGIDAIVAAVAGKYQEPVEGAESSVNWVEILIFLIIAVIILSRFFGSSTTFSSRGSSRNFWGGSGGFFPPIGGSGRSSGGGSIFRGGFGGMSGGGGASGSW